jgi:hypothetical protein
LLPPVAAATTALRLDPAVGEKERRGEVRGERRERCEGEVL